MDVTTNYDASLFWSVEKFRSKFEALSFARKLSALPVYSTTLNQMYFSYSIHLSANNLIVLPDYNDFTSMFHNINESAIRETQFYISVGAKSKELMLCQKDGGAMPLRLAVNRIIGQIESPMTRPFLPVVTKGNLRELSSRTHVLMLQAINVDALKDRSQFERDDIKRAVLTQVKKLKRVMDDERMAVQAG